MADAVLAVFGGIVIVIFLAAAAILVPIRRREIEARRQSAIRMARLALPGQLDDLDNMIEAIHNATTMRELDRIARDLEGR